MGILAVDVDGFDVRLATLRGGRVRILPGALGCTPLAMSRKGKETILGQVAVKRAPSHPRETIVGLGSLVGATDEEVAFLTGWREVETSAERITLGKGRIGLAKALGHALSEVVDPALMLMGDDLDRLVLTVPHAESRNEAWMEVVATLGVDNVQLVDRFVAALYAARLAHNTQSACIVDAGRLGVYVRLARKGPDGWVTTDLKSAPTEGLQAVEDLLAATLRERGGVPEGVASTAMLRMAAASLRRDLESVKKTTYPLPYSALGGTRSDNLSLSRQDVDRAFDGFIRTLRKMCVSIASETPEVVVLHGPASTRSDVIKTVREVFDAEVIVLKNPVVMGGPLIPGRKKLEAVVEAPPPRAAPHPFRFSVDAKDQEQYEPVVIDAKQASAPPPPKTKTRPQPEANGSAKSAPSIPPDAPTVPPAPTTTLPASGGIENPTQPAPLLTVDLETIPEPASIPQLLFGAARARLTGVLRFELEQGPTIRIPYQDGEPGLQNQERKLLVESLKFGAGLFVVETEPSTTRVTTESTHKLVTDAVRTLVWTFEEDAFREAFASRMKHAPRTKTADEALLLRRGFRKQEARFAMNACKGEEPLDVVLTRIGLGARGSLFVIAQLQMFRLLEWVA